NLRSEPALLTTTTPRTIITPRLDPEGFLSPPQLSLAFLLLSPDPNSHHSHHKENYNLDSLSPKSLIRFRDSILPQITFCFGS
ncbi:unnamed protein product, partial [Brassica rapa subsp. narinosa]